MLTVALLGLVGGLITGVSPCVLPMLPIIFFAGGASSTDRPVGTAPRRSAVGGGTSPADRGAPAGDRSGIDLLELGAPPAPAQPRRNLRPLVIIGGLVTSFSVFTLLGSTLLSALGLPDDLLRWIGLVVLSLVGIGLIVPQLGHLLERPFYKIPQLANRGSNAFVFGLGLGTLYVPCAGPILAAITVAGATGQVGVRTVVLTVSFAVGAALPLLIFAAAGARIQSRINAYRARAKAFRVMGGVVMILLAVALAFNVTDVLQRSVPAYTSGVEKKLAESKTVQGALSPFDDGTNAALANCTPGAAVLASCGPAPALRGTQQWFNTPGNQPLALDGLRGKVVLIDFFAYSCINCQRDAPYLKSWYAAYRPDGLEIIGVHSPEFAFEKSAVNLSSAIRTESLAYPVVQDNDLATWTAYRNRYWPAKYLIDAEGTVRAITFGEGNYAQTEELIRQLLAAAQPGVSLPGTVSATTAPSDTTAADQRTPELYLSPYRTAGYDGTPRVGRTVTDYILNPDQPADTFSYGGTWNPLKQSFASTGHSFIRLHYRAAKVYHVLSGHGAVTVSRPGRPDRTIAVSGTPNLYPIVDDATAGDETITLSYSKGIQAFTFSFG